MNAVEQAKEFMDMPATCRRSAGKKIFWRMAYHLDGAHALFYTIARQVFSSVLSDPAFADERKLLNHPGSLATGIFSAESSLNLAAHVPRVRGYLSAIAREPSPKTVIDAGCGSTAVLGLACAALHDSEVLCIELNPAAVACAKKIVELFGYSEDQVRVEQGNVLTLDFEQVDLAVTETFHVVMSSEPGPKIQNHLAKYAARLLPRYAMVYAQDEMTGHSKQFIVGQCRGWQEAGRFDFREPIDKVRGQFTIRNNGTRNMGIWIGYRTEEGQIVLDDYGVDVITLHRTTDLPPGLVAGDQVEFSFTPCGNALDDIMVQKLPRVIHC